MEDCKLDRDEFLRMMLDSYVSEADHFSKQDGIVSQTKAEYATKAAEALTALLSERERLREALEPFASFANLIDGDPAANPTGDLCPLTLDYDRINDGRIVSLGDCRRARAALEQKG